MSEIRTTIYRAPNSRLDGNEGKRCQKNQYEIPQYKEDRQRGDRITPKNVKTKHALALGN